MTPCHRQPFPQLPGMGATQAGSPTVRGVFMISMRQLFDNIPPLFNTRAEPSR